MNKVHLLLGIIIILLILGGLSYLMVERFASLGGGEEMAAETTSGMSAPPQSVEECLKELGYEHPIFIYSKTCPHCARVKPLVSLLVSENRTYDQVSTDDRDALVKINSCLSLQPYVPQYVCPVNGRIEVGETDLNGLRDFYDECMSG